MRKISKIERSVPVITPKQRVAAYARVSADSERLLHSLSAQVSYYSELIQKNLDWEYVGVYVDQGISGTQVEKRDEFKRLLEECNAGRVDIILTKSISRFARNTVELLESVRHLRNLGIEVRFEKERIHSMSGDGELMMTILASFAQEESRSTSENIKWAVQKGFQEGKPNGGTRILGYRWDGEQYIIIPEEAEIIRFIFSSFQKGISVPVIEMQLEEMGVKSLSSGHLGDSQIRSILRNERYAGDMLLQKYYIEDFITHKEVKNCGELPQYYVAGTHEGIIAREVFQAVQRELDRRREIGVAAHQRSDLTCFTSKLVCAKCGRKYHRKTIHNQIKDNYYVWKCHTKAIKGEQCDNCNIRESHLIEFAAEVLGLDEFDENTFREKIDQVLVIEPRDLIFHFKDGHTEQRHCVLSGHKDYWTPEMKARHSAFMSKENVRRWEERQRGNSKKCDSDTSND